MKINSKKRNIRIQAPIDMFPEREKLEVTIDNPNFTVFGETTIEPKPDLGISICDLCVESGDQEIAACITANAGDREAEATV